MVPSTVQWDNPKLAEQNHWEVLGSLNQPLLPLNQEILVYLAGRRASNLDLLPSQGGSDAQPSQEPLV